MSEEKKNTKNELGHLLTLLQEQYNALNASQEMKEEDLQSFIEKARQLGDTAVLLKYLNSVVTEEETEDKTQTAMDFESRPLTEEPLQYTSPEEAKSIAEKLGGARVRDLKKMIGINDRYQFVNELFEGSAQEFDIAVNQINNMADPQELNNYINGLTGIYNWTEENPVTETFITLVQSKFV